MNSHYTKQSRVLVADDDPIFTDLVCSSLASGRIDVVVADNGAEAMELIATGTFDAAIVDILMPVIDGLRLIALIRATPGLRQLPIMVVTGLADERTRVDCLQTGADDFLTKPVDWQAFPGRVAQLVARTGPSGA